MKLIAAVVCSFLVVSPSRGAERAELWLYYPTNFLVDKNIDRAEKIWKRAAAAGYTHLLIADSKFCHLDQLPRGYFKNCERAKKLAGDLHLQIVPALFSVGYSNDLLFNDPNLAEGVPVKDQPFVVKNGALEPVSEPGVAFGKVSFHDPDVTLDQHTATVHAGKGPARLVYRLNVTPFRCYHVSVKIKTDNFAGHPEIKAPAGDVSLQWQNISVKPTQDWSQMDVVFDSLDRTDVGIYFGLWSDVKGSLIWRDWSIEEVAFVNVLRRPGAPCVVTDETTRKPLAEGTDYESIIDPNLGNVPYNGEYTSYHTPPLVHTKLPNGTRLRASWYYPPIVYDGQVAACISEPKTMKLLADQSRRMKELWGAPLYMMSHDEFRVCNWDESCESTQKTPGKLLAENIADCTRLLRPAQSAVWNDMFDPFHNAVKGPYYLVNGPWTDSWLGLEKDVLVINWNHGKRDQSLKFFADRGNKQLIAGYYDNDLSELDQWKASAEKVGGVVGYMYTTWRGDYSQIEKFAGKIRETAGANDE